MLARVSNNYDTLYTLRVFSKNDIFCDFYQKIPPKSMKNKNAKVKMVQIHWTSSRYNSHAQHYSAKRTKPQMCDTAVLRNDHATHQWRHPAYLLFRLHIIVYNYQYQLLNVLITSASASGSLSYCGIPAVAVRGIREILWGDPVHEQPRAVLASKKPSVV